MVNGKEIRILVRVGKTELWLAVKLAEKAKVFGANSLNFMKTVGAYTRKNRFARIHSGGSIKCQRNIGRASQIFDDTHFTVHLNTNRFGTRRSGVKKGDRNLGTMQLLLLAKFDGSWPRGAALGT